MSSNRKLIAVMLSTVMLLSVVGPGLAAADDNGDGLTIEVEQNGDVVVTVTDDAGAVDNATVNVSVDDENVSYNGTGEYTTDENGTVSLEVPEEDVEVTITADSGDESAKKTVTLKAHTELSVSVEQAEDGTATVSVTENGDGVANASVNVTLDDENASYAGTGEYETDENGTVGLPAPEETVDIFVVAEYDNKTASTLATLAIGDELDGPFGQQVMNFVHSLINGEDDNKTIGQQIAEFVTKNNPGNAPDHAGPGGDQGPPEHAGNNTDDQGPPAHAGPPVDVDDQENDDN